MANESIKTFNLPFFSGIEAIAGRQIRNEFRRHIHRTYIIGMVEKGQRHVVYQGGQVQVSENEMFVFNPGQVHSCRSKSQSGHSYKALSVSTEIMQSIACQISGAQEEAPFFKNIYYKSETLADALRQLFDVMASPESDLQVESMLVSFLGAVIDSFSESGPSIGMAERPRASIRCVCEYIEQNFSQYLSLQQLSEVACLSQFHFQREFKRIIGITPCEYLSDCRIREAKKMLRDSGEIADIAIALGFFDQSHFSKIFKKTVGVSPGKFRKNNTG